MPGVWVRWRSTACPLQPQHLPSPALRMPPHLRPASTNHIPLLFSKLPFELSSSCVQLNLMLSKHPVPPTQSTWVHWDPNFMDCPRSKSSHVCTGQAYTAHPLELSLSKLILWFTFISHFATPSPGNFSSPPCSNPGLHGHGASAER